MNTIDILKSLIAFPTISTAPNRALIDFCADILKDAGAEIKIIEDDTGKKANLYVTIGPANDAGVLLSGHTDVVPVEGQDWHFPPFEMTENDGKLYGRGATDMKGFVASALSMATKAGKKKLKTPLHLALSYDEEIGCIGVRSLIEMLENAPFSPRFCIVGEPTLMRVATGHKGKMALQANCIGYEAHSALAPTALNAIHLACDLVSFIRELQRDIAQNGSRDDDYDVPYTTLHVGQIEGGIALNIVPNEASVRFEIRNLISDDPQEILDKIRIKADALLSPLKTQFPGAAITIDVTNSYPALDTPKDAKIVEFVQSLMGPKATIKVAFGTEGGLFSSRLNIPTIVCGPGSMEQGHKPDEFVSRDQLNRCDLMLDALLERLEMGL